LSFKELFRDSAKRSKTRWKFAHNVLRPVLFLFSAKPA